jgi:hypothetical protein
MKYVIDLVPVNVIGNKIYYSGDVPTVDGAHYVTLKKIYITSNNFIDVNKLFYCPLLIHSHIDNIFPYTQFFMYVFDTIIKKQKCEISDTSIIIHPHKKRLNADIRFNKIHDIERLSFVCALELNIQVTLKIKILSKILHLNRDVVMFDRFEQIFSATEDRRSYYINGSQIGRYFSIEYSDPRFISFLCTENDVSHIQKINYTLFLWNNHLRDKKEFETSNIITKKLGNYVLCFVPIQYLNDKLIEYDSFSDMRKDVKTCYELPEGKTVIGSRNGTIITEIELVTSVGCSEMCNTIYITYLW